MTYLLPSELAARMVGKVVRVLPRYVAPPHAFAAPRYERDEWTYHTFRAVRSDGADVLLSRALDETETGDVWIRCSRLQPISEVNR